MAGVQFLELYDLTYVKGGCKGDPPPGTTIDDTFGTYFSNYVIAIVGIAGMIALLRNGRAAPYKALGTNFFAWTAFGYGLAGILHQVYHEDKEHPLHTSLWKISYVATLLGIIALNLLTNQLLYDKFQVASCCQKVGTAITLLLGGAIIALNIFAESLILTGVYSGIVLLYVLMVFAILCQCMEALGIFLMISGYLVQVVLAPKCGDSAYADCFKDCPLPAPYFNHNALFHWLFAVGLAILAFAFAMNAHTETKTTELYSPVP